MEEAHEIQILAFVNFCCHTSTSICFHVVLENSHDDRAEKLQQEWPGRLEVCRQLLTEGSASP